MNLHDFRQNYPVKPHQIVRYAGKKVEVISYPWDESGCIYVLIRTKIGDPTTLETVRYSDLDTKSWFQINVPTNAHDVLGIKIGTFYIDFFLHPFFGTYFSRIKDNRKLRYRIKFSRFWRLMPDKGNV